MQSPQSNSSFLISQDHLQRLDESGWTLVDDLIPQDILIQIKHQAKTAWESGFFKPAQIGRGSEQQKVRSTRGDDIYWLENPEPPIRLLMQDLQTQLNQTLWLGINQFEVHFARYQESTGYEAHIDQSPRHNPLMGERLISFVLYLNENWQKHHAGELCIYDKEQILVEPIWGRILLFKSREILHAVMPSRAERWSLTGWFRKL